MCVYVCASDPSDEPKDAQGPHELMESLACFCVCVFFLCVYVCVYTVTPVHDTKLELVGPDGDACDPQPHQWRLGHVGDCIPAKTAPTDTQGLRDQKVGTHRMY